MRNTTRSIANASTIALATSPSTRPSGRQRTSQATPSSTPTQPNSDASAASTAVWKQPGQLA
jgi:hypothetical protein